MVIMDRVPPVKVGQECDVKINEVGRKGDGVTRIEGFVVFVPGTAKGEECRIQIKKVTRNFAFGEKMVPAEAKAEAKKTE